jgi:hypothetical protein
MSRFSFLPLVRLIKLLTLFNHTNSAPAPSTGGALGSVQGQASGGKKLEAETVSAETLSFLKNYNQ